MNANLNSEGAKARMEHKAWCVKAKRKGTGEVFTWAIDGVWDGTDAACALFPTVHSAAEFGVAHRPDWASEVFVEEAWWAEVPS